MLDFPRVYCVVKIFQRFDALLLAHHCSPLSYRSVDESDYRSAMIAFYELNSIIPFKELFIEQYEFASKNYAV
jgi:hypothetical protein